MRARQGGVCRLCGGRYEPGDEVNKYETGTAHESCIGNNFTREWKHASKRKGKSKR